MILIIHKRIKTLKDFDKVNLSQLKKKYIYLYLYKYENDNI